MDSPEMKDDDHTSSFGSTCEFRPQDLTKHVPLFSLPNEVWTSILSSPCPFGPEHFRCVAVNLIKNPNLTSSLVFRADIFYDSQNDVYASSDAPHERPNAFTKYMRAEFQPVNATVPGFRRQRTWVRQMIPRNPQLDKSLVQTCHLFETENIGIEEHLIVYIPHAVASEDIPFYHPTVRALAFVHTWDSCRREGNISIHYRMYESHPLDHRLERTALNLLKIIHKHGVGQLKGYQKRVHHDLVIDQKRFQDTYTVLKAKYAKLLIGDWQEQTDPTKHVFEDLGIAAFLIELWSDMYTAKGKGEKFPGFVDIGCGNGVLVNVLIQEGYQGWGFDCRRRKSWGYFPTKVQRALKEFLLYPRTLQRAACAEGETTRKEENKTPTHDGIFPPGTFIISNHADELTAWTPLLAYLNSSPFIVIPCCSHDLAGTRTRFKTRTKISLVHKAHEEISVSPSLLDSSPGPATGSLAKETSKEKQPSAYAALTRYVEEIAREVGYEGEKEILRIPSTRNAAILGRRRLRDYDDEEGKAATVAQIVEREVGPLKRVAGGWIERARKIAATNGDCC